MPARKPANADDTTAQTEGTEAAQTEGDVTGLTTDTPNAEAQQGAVSTLTADFLSAPISLDMTEAPDYVKATAPMRKRSARQQAMDTTVASLNEAWQKAGRPSVWGAIVNAKVVAYYFLPPEEVSDFKRLVNRAKLLHNLRIKWGSDVVTTPELIARFNLPAEYEGRALISFAAMDKRPRNTSGEVTTSQIANANDDDDDDDDDDNDDDE